MAKMWQPIDDYDYCVYMTPEGETAQGQVWKEWLPEDLHLCKLVDVPADDAQAIEHWHTIENALNGHREFIADLDAMSYWDGQGDGKQALARIDSAIEFVRQERQRISDPHPRIGDLQP